MQRVSLNEGWSVRPKANRWSDIMGDAAAWSPVTLPHDAVIAGPRDPEAGAATGYYPGGVWEYRRTVDIGDEDLDATLVLEFEGVYRDAFVTVNGTAAAHRPYGYSRFFVPIGPWVRAGENEVLVVATAHDDSRWYSGGGIYRNVWLHRGGALHVVADGIAVTTPEIDDDVATVVIEVEVENGSRRSAMPMVRVELADADGNVVAADEAPVSLFPTTTVSVRRRLHVRRPRRWGLDDPYRYSCRVVVSLDGEVVDEASTEFGIRALTLDPERGLRLNGEPILLRGTCVHHDNGVLGAASIDRAEHRRVELLKAAGFNAIRSAHNPASSGMLDACDRLGMLVMDETFDMWTQTKSDDDYALRFREWWEADVDAMVRRDRNHPSVIMYCTGNEITDGATPSGEAIARAIAARVRALDPTRYVVQAVSGLLAAGHAVFEDVLATIDPESGVNAALTDLGDLMGRAMRSPLVDTATAETHSGLDIGGYNYMETRYDLDVERYPHRLMVATESHPSRIDLCWGGVTDHPQVIGDFTWTGWDYLGEAGVGRVVHEERSERPVVDRSVADGASGATREGDTVPVAGTTMGFLGAYPWRTAWCGDVDITGERRPQSYFREIVWGLRSDPYVAVRRPEHHGRSVVYASPWAWSDSVGCWSWPGHEDASVLVEVYADADDVELLQDGESIGRAPAGREHGYRAEFETRYRPGTLEAVAWRGGIEIGRCELRSAVGDVRLGLRAERDVIVADPADLAYVAIELVDAAGVRFAGVDRVVQVVVEGPGVLRGLGSANPCTEEGFAAPECMTFDGRALAVVRPTGPGTLTVTATAEGCAAATASIDARAPGR